MNKLLLPLQLQFFAADTGGEGGHSSDGEETTETKTDETKQEHMIPKSRFDEVNNAFKEMKGKYDEMIQTQKNSENERQQKEQEEAEKKGKFENLYNQAKTDLETFKTETESAKGRIESLEGVIQQLLDEKMKSIDEEYHDLIPEGMTPEQKLSWVTNAESKGLFGNRTEKQPLGEQTNPKGGQEIDINKLSPIQLMKSGYGKQ